MKCEESMVDVSASCRKSFTAAVPSGGVEMRLVHLTLDVGRPEVYRTFFLWEPTPGFA